MNKLVFRQFFISILLLVPLAVLAQDNPEPLQSDWLELVKGSRGEIMGVELREVEEEPSGTRKLTLSVPKSSIASPDSIEEVIVIGRKPDKPEPLIDMSYEWVDDYDNDNYGLVIRLGKDSKWPIRLFMYSDTGFTR